MKFENKRDWNLLLTTPQTKTLAQVGLKSFFSYFPYFFLNNIFLLENIFLVARNNFMWEKIVYFFVCNGIKHVLFMNAYVFFFFSIDLKPLSSPLLTTSGNHLICGFFLSFVKDMLISYILQLICLFKVRKEIPKSKSLICVRVRPHYSDPTQFRMTILTCCWVSSLTMAWVMDQKSTM